jgi:hypothetical protein
VNNTIMSKKGISANEDIYVFQIFERPFFNVRFFMSAPIFTAIEGSITELIFVLLLGRGRLAGG